MSSFLSWLLLSKALTRAQGFLIHLTGLQQQSCVCLSATPLLPNRHVVLEEAAAPQAPQTGSLLAGGPQGDKKVGRFYLSDTCVVSVTIG